MGPMARVSAAEIGLAALAKLAGKDISVGRGRAGTIGERGRAWETQLAARFAELARQALDCLPSRLHDVDAGRRELGIPGLEGGLRGEVPSDAPQERVPLGQDASVPVPRAGS